MGSVDGTEPASYECGVVQLPPAALGDCHFLRKKGENIHRQDKIK